MAGESGAEKVLLVGHCAPDAFAMRSALGRYAPGAEFVFVNDDDDLSAYGGAATMLVNRVLDGRFDAADGIDLIRGLPADARARAALISDIPGAQDEAEAAGACPGFGKKQLYSAAAAACVSRLLAASANADREEP